MAHMNKLLILKFQYSIDRMGQTVPACWPSGYTCFKPAYVPQVYALYQI